MTRIIIDSEGRCTRVERHQRPGEIAIEDGGVFVSIEDLGSPFPDHIIPAPSDGLPIDQWGCA